MKEWNRVRKFKNIKGRTVGEFLDQIKMTEDVLHSRVPRTRTNGKMHMRTKTNDGHTCPPKPVFV